MPTYSSNNFTTNEIYLKVLGPMAIKIQIKHYNTEKEPNNLTNAVYCYKKHTLQQKFGEILVQCDHQIGTHF